MTIYNLNTFVVNTKLSLFFTIDARFLFLETDNIKLLVPMYIFDKEKKTCLKKYCPWDMDQRKKNGLNALDKGSLKI